MSKGRLEAFSDGGFAVISARHESAARNGFAGSQVDPSRLSLLHFELRVRRHLLEQSSPPVARVGKGDRRDSLG